MLIIEKDQVFHILCEGLQSIMAHPNFSYFSRKLAVPNTKCSKGELV